MSNEINSLTNISKVSNFEYESFGKKVEHKGNTFYVLTGRVTSTTAERLGFAFKALMITIFSAFVGLFFAQVREYWKNAIFSKRTLTVYASEDQLSPQIKAVIRASSSVLPLKPDNSGSAGNLGSKGVVGVSSSGSTENIKPKSFSEDVNLTADAAIKLLGNDSETEDEIEIDDLPVPLKHNADFLIRLAKEEDEDITKKILRMSKSNPIFSDSKAMLKLIEIKDDYVELASASLVKDRVFVLEVLDQSPEAAKYIPLPSIYKDDKELILKWVGKRADTYTVMSDTLKNDEEFIGDLDDAASQLTSLFNQLSQDLVGDRKVIENIKYDATVFNVIPKSRQLKKEILSSAAVANVDVIKYFPESVKYSREFMLDVIEQLSKAGDEPLLNLMDALDKDKNPLCCDANFVLKYLEITKRKGIRISTLTIFRHSWKLLYDETFMSQALKMRKSIAKKVSLPKALAENENMALFWIGAFGENIHRVSPLLKQNLEFMKKAREVNDNVDTYINQGIMRNGNKAEILRVIAADNDLYHLKGYLDELNDSLKDDKDFFDDFLVACMQSNIEMREFVPMDFCYTNHQFVKKVSDNIQVDGAPFHIYLWRRQKDGR